MINRRNLLIAFSASLFTPRTVFAQAKKSPVLIGWLATGPRAESERHVVAFKDGMAALGWDEGVNYVLEERWTEGQPARLPLLADELAAKRPALIFAVLVLAARAAAKAAPKTPIVVIGGDPVSGGLVASYARPGGMITGLSTVNPEVSEKFLELLLAAAPNIRRVGFLFSRNAANLGALKENARRSAAHYKVESRFAEVVGPEDVQHALTSFSKEGVQALIFMSTIGVGSRKDIAKIALSQNWPLVGGGLWAEQGGLISYGADSTAMYRRGAYYADRILKGAKPADLPIERPLRFELVVNLKTAKALGLTMPPEIMVQATRVIQ